MEWMLGTARKVHKVLNSPPGEVKNPSEFAKKEFCWTLHVLPLIEKPSAKAAEYGVPLQEFNQDLGQGRRDEKKNRDLDFEIALANLVPRSRELRELALSKQLLSENNSRALEKLEVGRLVFSKAEKNALKTLLDRLEVDY